MRAPYRLYPTKAQRAVLVACLRESRGLYNAMLERTTAQYAETGRFLFKYDRCAAFKGQAPEHVPATTVQCLAERLDKALRAYLFRKEHAGRAGFPRFKSATQWHAIRLRQHPGDFAWDNGRLKVPATLGKRIKLKLHRPLEGTPTTCQLVLRADGHWYALIACDVAGAAARAAPDPRPAIGLDVGLRVFLADSNGAIVENPRCYRTSQAALRRKQRVLSRRMRGSHRRHKAARNVAKTHLKVARQRRDFLFKTAKPYADGYRLIAAEDLNVAGMVHGTLAKSIHDAAWSTFLDILTDKAERAGGKVVWVPARFTSQKCSRCGEIVAKSLSVRTHLCPHCGYMADRDTNAAQNILRVALETGGGTAFGDVGR